MNREAEKSGSSIFHARNYPERRVIAEIRLVLALVTLAVIGLYPTSDAQLRQLLYGAIATYILSALALYWVALNRQALVRQGLIYWLDTGWLLVIISLSGISNLLFLLLLFPVLVAAAQAGFVQGLAVSWISTLAYTLLSWGRTDANTQPELLLQAGTLLALGFMELYWGGAEFHLKRELSAFSRLGKLPGRGDDAERFWTDALKGLVAYFGAGSAFFLGQEENGSYRIYQYEIDKPGGSLALADEQASVLTRVPESWAIVWRSFFRDPRRGHSCVVDMPDAKTLEGVQSQLLELAHILEAKCWLSFPLSTGSRYRGRVFLLGLKRFKGRLEWGFIAQLSSQISLQWDNLLLARQLTRVASSGERERISRDLHDGTVQPYLGLKFGLEALRRKVTDTHPLVADIDELVRMTEKGGVELRNYIHDLRAPEAGGACPALTAIQAQVQQFEAYSGLKVEIRAHTLDLSKYNLIEVRQIIAEGLSNIRRHSIATEAIINICVEQGMFAISFIHAVTGVAPAFTPRTLTERAAAMGGRVDVIRLANQTEVKVILPLWVQPKNER